MKKILLAFVVLFSGVTLFGQTELIDESVGYVVHYNSKNGYKYHNDDVKNYIKGFYYV